MSACRGRRDGGSWRERPRSSSLLQYSSLHLNLNSLFMFLYWLSCLSRRRAGFRRGLCSRRHSIIACSLPLFPISASLRRPFSPPMFPRLVIFHLSVLLFLLLCTSLSLYLNFSFYPSHTSLSLQENHSSAQSTLVRFRPMQRSSLNVAMTISPLLGV